MPMNNTILKNLQASGGSIPFVLPNPYSRTTTFGMIFVKKAKQRLQPIAANKGEAVPLPRSMVQLNIGVYGDDVPDPLFIVA